MHSITLWKDALAPNYSTNMDRTYPYSQVPHLGGYELVTIPVSLNDLIDHVDYWGEGKVISPQGISGFSNCYNINQAYHLVSNGCDRNRKIPNRIPVLSYDECDTSAYVKHNSVLIVTVMGAPINSSCAADIARIVNKDLGIVVAYGYESGSRDIANLSKHLKDKGIYHCPKYELPNNLQEVTLFNNHMVFLNSKLMKEELSRLISNGVYAEAVYISREMDNKMGGSVIDEVVSKLLNGNPADHKSLMSYGYQLWINNCKDIVSLHFPASFKLILGQEKVKIVNMGYNQALKLDVNKDRDGDRIAWGDDHDVTSVRVSWTFIPYWIENHVTFTIFNNDCKMYLKLAYPVDSYGDRQAFGSKDSDSDRHKFVLEPFIKKGVFGFYIINLKYGQGLKLDVNQDGLGDRYLWAHNGDIYKDDDRFKWIISEW